MLPYHAIAKMAEGQKRRRFWPPAPSLSASGRATSSGEREVRWQFLMLLRRGNTLTRSPGAVDIRQWQPMQRIRKLH